MTLPSLVRDLSDEELRAAGSLKWSMDGPGVIPAWVAEMDFTVAEPIRQAVLEYASGGVFGYPDLRADAVAQALSHFSARHWKHAVDPNMVVLAGDVMEGLALTLNHVAPAGPVIVPTPIYPPFLVSVDAQHRRALTVPLIHGGDSSTRHPRLRLDLEAIEDHARAGARVLLLCHPHNPVGRCYSRAELTALCEVVERHGIHVISDEIHAPLVLPGTEFIPYAAVASASAAITTLISATKAFNMPGLRCAQVINARDHDHAALKAVHPALNHAMTTLGRQASLAAYIHSDAWLDEVRSRIATNHTAFAEAMAALAPRVRIAPAEATYLAWLDVSDVLTGEAQDAVCAALEQGVRVDSQGMAYGPGSQGHLRVNLATSAERTLAIAQRLAAAWS